MRDPGDAAAVSSAAPPLPAPPPGIPPAALDLRGEEAGEASVLKSDLREQAEVDDLRSQTQSRRALVELTGRIFLGMNGGVFALVALLAAADTLFIALDIVQPADRLITGASIMALIGATAVQLGAAYMVIVRYLFPANDGGSQV